MILSTQFLLLKRFYNKYFTKLLYMYDKTTFDYFRRIRFLLAGQSQAENEDADDDDHGEDGDPNTGDNHPFLNADDVARLVSTSAEMEGEVIGVQIDGGSVLVGSSLVGSGLEAGLGGGDLGGLCSRVLLHRRRCLKERIENQISTKSKIFVLHITNGKHFL